MLRSVMMVTFLGLSLCGCAPRELVLVQDGRSDYVLVHADKPAKGDDFVIKDVAGLLSRIVTKGMAVTNVSAAPREKRIFYGIVPPGVDPTKFAEQEYHVMTRGSDVYLFGQGANGARLAAYSFLQKDLGFRFFDTHGGVGLPQGKLSVPPMNVTRQPPFRFRYLNGESGMNNRPDSTLFLFRHGQNSWSGVDLERSGIIVPQDECRIMPPHAHSLRYYLPADAREPTFAFIRKRNLPPLKETHPEYFTLSATGRRIFDSQYCLSNPGCRQELKARLLENMRLNPQKNVFDLSAGDTPGQFCYCTNCTALIKKYGTVAGPLLDFIIWACPEIKEKYPNNLVMSLIYRKTQTQPPPKGLDRLPDNFMPDFAPIDDNFAKDWYDPSNTNTYADLVAWCRLCKNVMVWYYPNPYGAPGGHLSPPLGNVERAVNDLLLMKKAGVTAHIWEHNVGVKLNVGFTELESYVYARLMNDVSLDWHALADEFIAFEYGAAAADFKKYWLEQENLRKQTPLTFRWNANADSHVHLTPERIMRWQNDFDRMEALVKDDPARLFAIRRVRVGLDAVALHRYLDLAKIGFKTPLDALAKRVLDVSKRVCNEYEGPRCKGRNARVYKGICDFVEVEKLQNGVVPAPLPGEIFGNVPADRIFTTLPKVHGAAYEKDETAAYGLRAVFTNNKRGFKLPLDGAALEDHVSGAYHRLPLKLTAKNLPPRGKYQFYKLGAFTLSTDCVFRFGVHDSWDFKANVSRAWEFGSHNRATGWMSFRCEGPLFYPEDAGRENRIFCDRVVIVRE